MLAVSLARLFTSNPDGPRPAASEIRKELGRYALEKYLGAKDFGGEHAERVQRSLRAAKILGASSNESGGRISAVMPAELAFGRWWMRRPGGFCVSDGCPCLGALPCFEKCDETTGCAIPSGKSVEGTGNGELEDTLGNAVAIRRQAAHLGAEKRLITFHAPRGLLVLFDLSETMGRPSGSPADGDAESPPLRRGKEFLFGLISEFEKNRGPLDRLFILGFHENALPVIGPVPSKEFPLETVREMFSPRAIPFSAELLSAASEFQKKHNFEIQPERPADLPAALHAALQQLSSDSTNGLAVSDIVLITAGLTSCQRSVDPKSRGACDPLRLGACEQKSCSHLSREGGPDAYANHILSMREAAEEIYGAVSGGSNVSVHVALVGNAAQPHTVLIPHPGVTEKRCLTDEELRLRNYLNVTWHPFTVPEVDPNFTDFETLRSAEGGEYAQPNVFHYALVKATGGIWAPIRPPCPAPPYGFIGDLNGNSIEADLDDYCSRIALLTSMSKQPEVLDDPQRSADFRVYHQELVAKRITDQEGRLICEPTSAGYSAQGARLMQEIAGRAEQFSYAIEP